MSNPGMRTGTPGMSKNQYPIIWYYNTKVIILFHITKGCQ